MKHDVAGDPITGVKWTRRTTRKISQELLAAGIHVSSQTVARILKDLDYSLRVNHKNVSKGSGSDRDEQFKYISEQRTSFGNRDLPIVSIDSKKKELVGNFKNQGTAWKRKPELVRDHDFRSDAEGMATPYGIYDVRANRGAVFVGTSFDTPDFAAENLARWWEAEGRKRYPGATELLVLADGGGSNGPRNRAFKHGLQTRLCDSYGISVTLCHYPAGASKWNPIEHRLFSEISKNWKGCPLRSYETIVNYISTTRTETGLRVTAQLVDKEYPKGVKIQDAQMAALDITPHKTQPLRNYTIRPRSCRSKTGTYS
jgi:hypothetical protein